MEVVGCGDRPGRVGRALRTFGRTWSRVALPVTSGVRIEVVVKACKKGRVQWVGVARWFVVVDPLGSVFSQFFCLFKS